MNHLISERSRTRRLFILHPSSFILLLLVGLAACSPAGGTEPAAEPEHTEEEAADHPHEEGEAAGHDHSDGRIPNDGAVIHITAPGNGAVFGAADEILVAVETENFNLMEEGKHWHVYVDDVSYGMIMGGDIDQALRNLSPGTHEISVYLSNEAHEELAEGDAVVITVE